MAVLPMFPLGSVLLPGGVLPLHVFEPRYRRLVGDCLQAEVPEFGVVLIERGSEVGGGDQRASWGTVARMVQVAELGDDRFAVVSVGARRVRVLAWLPDDPYPLADVEDWPDEDPDPPGIDERIDEVAARVRRCAALAIELGDDAGDPTTDIAQDPVVASYHLCALAPIGPADRHRLLGARGPRERLELLDRSLDDVEALLQLRLAGGLDDDPSDEPGGDADPFGGPPRRVLDHRPCRNPIPSPRRPAPRARSTGRRPPSPPWWRRSGPTRCRRPSAR
jgi:Lon protease-like protein